MTALSRRSLLVSAVAFGATLALPRQALASSTRAILEAELASGRPCRSEAAALRGTLSRMGSLRPPTSGRTIVVDLPSQQLAAYTEGSVELESRVVVGEPAWKTPDLDTTISYVRFNPTWTVPESILKARSWRSKLAGNPRFFQRLNFLVELNGQMIDPADAADSASRVGRFVQQPGKGNALGKVKLGLRAGNAIYLHDTNDPGAFDGEKRALSHGCMRVEEALGVAAWVLGISGGEADGRVSDDDRKDYTPPSPIRVVTTYFTAWPDANGVVQYYPDVYGRDGGGSDCGQSPNHHMTSSYDGGGSYTDDADRGGSADYEDDDQ